MKHILIRKHTDEEFECLNEIWDFIEIKESIIPDAGVGVFAIDNIPNNILLGWYKGFITNKAINNEYVWNFNSDINPKKRYKLEADICTTSNPLAFVNAFKNEKEKKLHNLNKIIINDRVYYQSIKEIKKGDELIVDYESKSYFNK